jgi:RNA polymerase sigma factor (sigma-70 family)
MDRNRDLFWELLEPEHQTVRAFCRRLAGNRQDGDDLCQEALLVAFQRFAQLRELRSFKAWLYRIVVNRYRSKHRLASWRRLVTLESLSGGNGSGPDPEPAYESRRLLEFALGRLTADDRALITLYELEDWTCAELAKLLSKSETSVKVQLFRIRKRMRDALTRKIAKDRRHGTAEIAGGKERLWIVTKPSVD